MGRKILNILSTVLLIVMIAIVVLIFVARLSGKSPSVFGYHIFRVSSESMTPTLEIGDVILVKECAPEDIHYGDIVTYNGREGEFKGKMITHRVAQEPEERDGEYYYRTKGDKVGAVLDPEISYSQIEGKYVNTLPFIDKLYSFFLSSYGLFVFIILIVVLFGYEIISLVVSYKRIDENDEEYYAPPNRKPKKKRKK